ncbi:hypothetical protein D3C72_1298080 [compost metagenome]
MFFRAWVLIRSETRPKAGSATMYTSGWPKNQNRCWNRIGLPPWWSSCCPMEIIAGMKKLVPSRRSNSIMMALTNSAGKASRARIEAMKMPQTESGMRNRVMPWVRACSTVVT